MQRCWSCSPAGLEESQCAGDASPAQPHWFPHRAFWGSLTASLLLIVIVLSINSQLGSKHSDPQIFRITGTDKSGSLINQSVLVNEHNNVVTYTVTSANNQTSSVLFDITHGLICFKPGGQQSCFLHRMNRSDYENMQTLLSHCTHKERQLWLMGNETQTHTEFFGVLGQSPVEVSTLQEPLQSLCRHNSIHWVRKTDGPAKQRLIYFCIDICFPSNICMSVCFYYLPE